MNFINNSFKEINADEDISMPLELKEGSLKGLENIIYAALQRNWIAIADDLLKFVSIECTCRMH